MAVEDGSVRWRLKTAAAFTRTPKICLRVRLR